MSFRPSGWGRIAYAPESGTMGSGRLLLDVCRHNRVRTFVHLAGTSGRAYAIRPYPFGRKIGTLKRCGFKKQSCLFDRQGRGVLNTPPNRARQGPGGCLWMIVGQTGYLHPFPWRGRQGGRMQYAPTHSDEK